MKLPIYMDYHATTPLDPRVLGAMTPYFTQKFGNAASKSHSFGWEAEAAVTKARGQIAAILGTSSQEIIFTSGATESNNLALQGVWEAHGKKGAHLITCVTEHKAILDVCKELEKKGAQVTYLSVDSQGRIDREAFKSVLTDRTILVSLMAANNEIGTIHPLEEIGSITRERGILFHTDAAQALGKIPLDMERMKIDLLSASGHKICGPKGVGVLYVRSQNPRLKPLIWGGGHERGLRSGTLNVPGVVGMGEACRIAAEEGEAESDRLRTLRDRLYTELKKGLEDVLLNGPSLNDRLAQNLNLSFPFVKAEALMMAMKEVAVSSGSACTSASPHPSHVIKALGRSDDEVHSSIRFGLGRFTSEDEVDYVAKRVVELVKKIRGASPAYQMVKEVSSREPSREPLIKSLGRAK